MYSCCQASPHLPCSGCSPTRAGLCVCHLLQSFTKACVAVVGQRFAAALHPISWWVAELVLSRQLLLETSLSASMHTQLRTERPGVWPYIALLHCCAMDSRETDTLVVQVFGCPGGTWTEPPRCQAGMGTAKQCSMECIKLAQQSSQAQASRSCSSNLQTGLQTSTAVFWVQWCGRLAQSHNTLCSACFHVLCAEVESLALAAHL